MPLNKVLLNMHHRRCLIDSNVFLVPVRVQATSSPNSNIYARKRYTGCAAPYFDSAQGKQSTRERARLLIKRLSHKLTERGSVSPAANIYLGPNSIHTQQWGN